MGKIASFNRPISIRLPYIKERNRNKMKWILDPNYIVDIQPREQGWQHIIIKGFCDLISSDFCINLINLWLN